MKAIITILDGATETSMPFNEFVIYRASHYSNERQILIICGAKRDLPEVKIPGNLEIIYAGRNLKNIRKTIQNAIAELKEANIPFVIHIHQVQSGFLAQMAMLGTGFRKKTLFTVHSTFSGYKLHNKLLSFVNALLADRITCVSNTSYQDYPAFIKRIKNDRIQGVQNGVDTERIDAILSTTVPALHDGIDFIYVARMIPLKNHGFLVDVLKRCDKRVHFTFVGAEDADRTIRHKAEELGVSDRITFTGLIPRNEVFRQLQNADYYISSSTLEGLPVSVLEAMYCGLPCVLSDIPQHREVAEDKATILPYDVTSWANEINRLAELSVKERAEQSAQVKDYAAKNFSLAKMHENYDVIYRQL